MSPGIWRGRKRDSALQVHREVEIRVIQGAIRPPRTLLQAHRRRSDLRIKGFSPPGYAAARFCASRRACRLLME